MSRRHDRFASEAQALADVVHARLDALGGKSGRLAEAEARLTGWPGGTRFDKLAALFSLTPADRAVLLTTLVPRLDPPIATRYQEVSGRPWATEWLAARLFGMEGELLFHPGSALSMWRLVTPGADQPGEPQPLVSDPAIRGWIHGQLGVEPMLAGAIRRATPMPDLPGWPIGDTARRIAAITAGGIRAVLTVEGLPGAGRATFVANVAQTLGQRALIVTPNALPIWNQETTLRAHRHALVAGAALIWRGPATNTQLSPPGLWPPALQAVTHAPGEEAVPPEPLAHLHLVLPSLDRDSREKLIQNHLPGAEQWPRSDRARLAQRPALTPGAITRIARTAPANPAHALEAANAIGAASMGELATRMATLHDWDELVLDAEQDEALRDLAHEAGMRAETWENPELRRLFGREAGLIALFHGPSGTGKTMAAQVIAGTLGLDLYRIDCAAVTSKYIGETAKNLRAIFSRARAIDAVLFFDEAEALFSRRTEVRDSHDRYANADTSYLLQLIEGGFEGTAILATNRMGDMDRAFLRRIRYVFEFHRPSPEAREAIWRRAAQALTADKTETLWPVLAKTLDVTGAQIKTILLSAHFKAARHGRPIGPEEILTASIRELAKEGRDLSDRDQARIRAHA
jgi:hypothetical protein